MDIDFDKWQSTGIPLPLIAACAACQNGVKRAHLVDAQMDGSLLLELYSRDGVGVMLSADFYEVGTAAWVMLSADSMRGAQQHAVCKMSAESRETGAVGQR